MLAVDTNILVYAADIDSPFYGHCRDWLERQRAKPDAWVYHLADSVRVLASDHASAGYATTMDRTSSVGICPSIARIAGP